MCRICLAKTGKKVSYAHLEWSAERCGWSLLPGYAPREWFEESVGDPYLLPGYAPREWFEESVNDPYLLPGYAPREWFEESVDDPYLLPGYAPV